MRLVLFGPPGSGKGTQAELLAEKLNIPTISTGSIFRGIVAEGGECGEMIASYIDHGEFVPDEITNQLVAERLDEPDTENGFLLDGYPRTIDQLETLESLLEERGTPLDRAVLLAVPDEMIVDRILKRAEIEGRADDTAEVIQKRLDVYKQQTEPLKEAYSKLGIVALVDGTGTVDEVHERLVQELS